MKVARLQLPQAGGTAGGEGADCGGAYIKKLLIAFNWGGCL